MWCDVIKSLPTHNCDSVFTAFHKYIFNVRQVTSSGGKFNIVLARERTKIPLRIHQNMLLPTRSLAPATKPSVSSEIVLVYRCDGSVRAPWTASCCARGRRADVTVDAEAGVENAVEGVGVAWPAQRVGASPQRLGVDFDVRLQPFRHQAAALLRATSRPGRPPSAARLWLLTPHRDGRSDRSAGQLEPPRPADGRPAHPADDLSVGQRAVVGGATFGTGVGRRRHQPRAAAGNQRHAVSGPDQGSLSIQIDRSSRLRQSACHHGHQLAWASYHHV